MAFQPSEQQLAICAHGRKSRPLMVFARAGTGKSSTLEMFARSIPKEQSILACCFNKDIRAELERRMPSHVKVKSFNQMGFAALSEMRKPLRLSVDAGKQRQILRDIVPKELRDSVEGPLLRLLAMCMARVIESPEDIEATMDEFDFYPPDNIEGATPQRMVAWVQDALYVTRQPSAVVSYDDQVYIPAYYIRTIRMPKFDHVLVDEYQDVNPAQRILIQASLKPGGKLTMVGDPAQAIYAFRGAMASAMETTCKELNAEVLPLNCTYRCARKIVAEAQRYVPDYHAAPNAPEGVVEEVEYDTALEKVREGDFIISRTNAPLVTACLALMAKRRKAVIRGKDVGTGLAKLVTQSKAQTIPELVDWWNAWRDKEVRRALAVDKPNRAEEAHDKANAVLSLAEHCDTVGDLLKLLEELFKDNTPSNNIVLTSTHKAKGLEADRVWMFNWTYRPQKGGEEANLSYVAITRAKKELYLVNPRPADAPKTLPAPAPEETAKPRKVSVKSAPVRRV